MTDAASLPPDAPEAGLVIEQVHSTRSLDADRVRQVVEQVVAGEGFTIRYLGVILADHATVHRLNRDYLDHDYETDVLSFALDDADEAVIDGEVYVDLDTAAERHAEFGTSFEAEACRYVVHGVLHLMGYDDATPAGKAEMRRLEDRYLGARGA